MKKIYSKRELPDLIYDEIVQAGGQWIVPTDLAKKYNIFPRTVGLIIGRMMRDGKPIEQGRFEDMGRRTTYRWTGGNQQ